MKDYLIPVNLKLRRAKQQIDDIHERLKNWTTESKFKISTSLLPDKLGISIETGNYSDDGFLDDVGLNVGEIIHNLRSSLDNLAYAMARHKIDPPKFPHKIFFPIFDSKEEFDKKTKDVLNQVQESTADLIKSAQPYNFVEKLAEFEKAEHPFNILQVLNNFDKHRIPKVFY